MNKMQNLCNELLLDLGSFHMNDDGKNVERTEKRLLRTVFLLTEDVRHGAYPPILKARKYEGIPISGAKERI